MQSTRKLAGAVLILALLLTPSQAFAWTITADFESGSPGTLAKGANAFHEAGARTTFSKTMAHSGSQSAKMEWLKGTDGWANTRGTLFFPSKVVVGQEIWGRAYFYFQSPWSWGQADQSQADVQKILRFHKARSDGSNGGLISIFGTATADPRGDCEFCNLSRWNLWQNKNLPATKLEPGRWYSLEQYVYFHPKNGVYRMWIDGVLKVEDLNIDTANDATTTMGHSFLMGYWNGGVPQDQVQFIDDIFITTDRPANRDATGNPMIGPAPETPDTVPPKAPTGVRIQ